MRNPARIAGIVRFGIVLLIITGLALPAAFATAQANRLCFPSIPNITNCDTGGEPQIGAVLRCNLVQTHEG